MKINRKLFYKLILIVVFALLSHPDIYCQQAPDSAVIYEEKASISLIICSRGCYQYLLHINNPSTSYFLLPQELPDSLQSNNLEVLVSGIIKYDSAQIYKAGANDKPIPYFKVPTIKINSIKKIEY